MVHTRSKLHNAISGKRAQEWMGIDGEVGSKRRHLSDNGGIDALPDDVLIHIVSRLSLKEAGKVSVLARRWRYLWRSAYGTLRFDNRDTAIGSVMGREKFESWVNTVVELHQAQYIEGMAICFEAGGGKCNSSAIHSWVNFAMQKKVERFELNLSFDNYEFPSVGRLISHSHSHRLRTLRLDHVDIMDHVVHYFLASCHNLEELCIHFSKVTKNLKVDDPPRLRVLEVHRCLKVQSLEISAVNLVSLKYGGGKKSLKLKKVPNLRDLTISHDLCVSFVIGLDDEDNWSYSIQLEKLVLDFQLLNSERYIIARPVLPHLCSLRRLEVQVFTKAGFSLSFLPRLLKECPQLCEYRVEMFHSIYPTRKEPDRQPFCIGQPQADAKMKCVGHRVKVVEIAGYIGCWSDDELVVELLKTGGRSIQRVAIDTRSAYYDDLMLEYHMTIRRRAEKSYGYLVDSGAVTRNEAIKRAKALVSKFPRRIKSTVI